MVRLISALVVVVLVLAAAFESDSLGGTRAEHAFKSGLPYALSPEEPLAEFVRKTVADVARSSGDTRQIRVNKAFDRHQINVLLVDFNRLPADTIAVPRIGLYSVRPNVLVIDAGMARALVLNAFNDSLSFMQMLMNEEHRAKNGVKVSDTLLDPESEGALAFHLRLRNLRFPDKVAHFGDEIVSQTDDPGFLRTLGLAFVFPVGHELFHVRPAKQWLPRLSHLIEREEAQADQHASKLIAERLASSSKNLDAQLAVLSMRHFQDIVLSDVLRDFRGLDAEDYLSVLFHRPCKQAKQIPWPLRVHNPDVVFGAAERSFPVLSEKESRQIEERLKRFSNETHGSLLQRILQMRAAFSKNPTWAQVVGSGFRYARALDAAYFSSAGPTALVRQELGRSSAVNVGLDGLLRNMAVQDDWQQGAGCPHGECGLMLWRDAYMEAHLRDGVVVNLRIVEPLAADDLARTRSVVAYFFGYREAQRLQREIVESSADCKVGTFSHEGGGYTVLSHVLNESGMIETEIDVR